VKVNISVVNFSTASWLYCRRLGMSAINHLL